VSSERWGFGDREGMLSVRGCAGGSVIAHHRMMSAPIRGCAGILLSHNSRSWKYCGRGECGFAVGLISSGVVAEVAAWMQTGERQAVCIGVLYLRAMLSSDTLLIHQLVRHRQQLRRRSEHNRLPQP
jgi:hypothetical protein